MALNHLGQDERGHGPGIPPEGVTLTRQKYSKHKPDRHPHVVALHLKLKAANLPGIRWKGSPNYTPGRNGSAADSGVQHTTVGNAASAQARFQSAAAQVSTHFVACEDGWIDQYVALSDGAWGAGEWTANMRATQLEREDSGDYNRPFGANPTQASAIAIWWSHLADLGYLTLAHGFPGGIVGHKEVPGSSTACPDGINVDEVIALALAGGIVTPPPVADQVIRTYIPIQGQAFDVSPPAPNPNDRGYYNLPNYDYSGFDAAPGLWIPVNRAYHLPDGTWYWGLADRSDWSKDLPLVINDNALDTSRQGDADGHPGAYSPTDFVAWPVSPAPAPTPTPAPTPPPMPLPTPTPTPAPVPGGLLEDLQARVGVLEAGRIAGEGRLGVTEADIKKLATWAKELNLK